MSTTPHGGKDPGLASTDDPALLRELDAVIGRFRAETGTVHLIEDGMLVLRAIRGHFPPPVMDAIRRIPIGKGMAGLAAQRREPVTACNIQTDTSGDVRPGAKATGMEGAIVVPMLRPDGTLRGTLGIANSAARDFTDAERRELLAAAQALAERR